MICHLQQGSHSWSQSPTEPLPGDPAVSGGDCRSRQLRRGSPTLTDSLPPPESWNVGEAARCLLCRPQQFSPPREDLGASSEWTPYLLEDFPPSPDPLVKPRTAGEPPVQGSHFPSPSQAAHAMALPGTRPAPSSSLLARPAEGICRPGCCQLLFGEPGCALGALPSLSAREQHPSSEQGLWGHSTRPREGDPQSSHWNEPAGVPSERQDSVLVLLPGE